MDVTQRIAHELVAILEDYVDEEQIENRVAAYLEYLETDHFDGEDPVVHDSQFAVSINSNNDFEVGVDYRTGFNEPVQSLVVDPVNGLQSTQTAAQQGQTTQAPAVTQNGTVQKIIVRKSQP